MEPRRKAKPAGDDEGGQAHVRTGDCDLVVVNDQDLTFDDLFTLLTTRHRGDRKTNYNDSGKIK